MRRSVEGCRTKALAHTAGVAAATFALLTSGPAGAITINDDITFTTTGQSMWSEGGAAVFTKEVFLGVRWGTYDVPPPPVKPPGPQPETLTVGGIVGEEKFLVPGTGGTIPNPARIAWDVAFAACRALGFSSNTCINGAPAVKACAPSWLGGGCTTIVPKLPGLGNAPPSQIVNPIPGQFIDTRTGLLGGLETSGEAGIVPWVEAFGGGIDVKLPVGTTITLPDDIQSGTPFSVTTKMSVKNSATNPATITANAPSFKAGVDGLINMDNTFSGEACFIFAGCVEGEKDLDIMPGRFGIVGIDTTEDNFLRVFGTGKGENTLGVPGIAFNKQYIFYAPTPENPDGVDDEVTPKKVPSPRLGDIEVGNLHDFTGGTLDDSKLVFTTNQQLLSVNVSVTGVAELSLGSPGILSNKIDLIPILLSLGYTLLDVGVGPRFGMQQDFEFTPDVWVKLDFDQPVVRRLGDGTLHESPDGIVEVALGDDVELLFEGEVGALTQRTFFMKEPHFSNVTKATIDPGLKLEIGCLKLPAIDPLCLFRHDFTTTGLLGIPVYTNDWTLEGFNQRTLLGVTSTGVGAQDVGDGAAVSEPATVALLAIALLWLGFSRRRELVRVDFRGERG